MMKKSSEMKELRKRSCCWSKRFRLRSTAQAPVSLAILLLILCSSVYYVFASDAPPSVQEIVAKGESEANLPSNHRMEGAGEDGQSKTKARESSQGRQGRQYDAPMGTSSSGTYAAVSGDGAAYVAQMPLTGSAGYTGGANLAPNYVNDLSAGYHSANSHHDPLGMARGYPMSPVGHAMHSTGAGYPSTGSLSSMFAPGGFLSGSTFPLASKGFDVTEIICTAIAVAVGAVIVGAPFILIYLFIMSQVNGGGSGMGTNGGAINLTGPTSSTTVSGRKKRHTSLSEALFRQLSPLVNSEQVASTFKALMSSMAKYQM